MPRIYLSIYLCVDPYRQKRKDCIELIDRSAARKFSSLCHAKPTLLPESTIRPCFEYIFHIWSGALISPCSTPYFFELFSLFCDVNLVSSHFYLVDTVALYKAFSPCYLLLLEI